MALCKKWPETGRAASGGALALEPPRATGVEPESLQMVYPRCSHFPTGRNPGGNFMGFCHPVACVMRSQNHFWTENCLWVCAENFTVLKPLSNKNELNNVCTSVWNQCKGQIESETARRVRHTHTEKSGVLTRLKAKENPWRERERRWKRGRERQIGEMRSSNGKGGVQERGGGERENADTMQQVCLWVCVCKSVLKCVC